MSTAINYLNGFSSAEQERQALVQLYDYLISKGKYKDRDAAHKDARQRVDFLEKADFFSDDETLADASEARKFIAALIQGHNLRPKLEDNAGYLPGMAAGTDVSGDTGGQDTTSPTSSTADTTSGAPGSQPATPVAGKRPITEIFAAIEMDLRTGMSKQQIISKLVDSGIASDNAEDALAVVLKQRQHKRRTRVLAAVTIVLLSLVLFYFAR